MKSKEGAFFFLSTLFLLSSLAFNAVFFNIAKFKPDVSTSHSINNGVHFDFLDEAKAPLVKGKCIYMVVDAMRYDFVFPSDLKNVRMPFLTRLLREQKAAPFKLNAWPPTVTLPRIKSLVSGIIPEFIDILWNFNTTYLVEDNFLRQFKKKQKSITFFGDDTWLKLFDSTKYFLRHDGVSSFVASDYYEVDTNVTRHLKSELTRTDWDLMILHYLGLDHVGHIEGPFAPVNIKRKLFEMDEIIHRIYSSLGEDDLLMIVSDHGMANEGGHGGSSRMETLTPLVMISNSKFSDDKKLSDVELEKLIVDIPVFEQVDLVSTLSCLYDLPVPENNRGVMFINEFVKNLNRFQFKSKDVQATTLRCLQQNLKQLDKLLGLKEDTEFVGGINSQIREFRNKIEEHGSVDDLIGINMKYQYLLKKRMAKEKDSNGINQKQSFYMILVLTCMINLYMIIASFHFNSSTGLVVLQTVKSKWRLVLSLIASILLVYLINTEVFKSDVLASTNNIMLALSLFFVCFNVNLFLNTRSLKEYVRAVRLNSSSVESFYVLSAALYLLSLFSSSFIEEEHQIWFYLETTQLYLIVFWSADKWSRLRHLVKPFLLIAVTRVLRSVNQTGNKWIHLKDIGDFLRESESKFLLVIVATISLIAIYAIQNLIELSKAHKISLNPKIWIINYCLVLIYQITVCTELFDLYKRNLIAKVGYLTMLVNLVINLLAAFRYDCKRGNTTRVIRSFHILQILANFWLLFNCLIQPSTNLLVLALWQIKEYLLITTFLSFNSSLNATGTRSYTKTIFFYIIINQMCYFSQGNSNSLNTIQVSTGLVGITETNMFVSAFLMFSATYASNIYWFLVSLKHLYYEKMNNEESLLDVRRVISDTISFKAFATTTVCTLYTMSAFLQREHLFVWSVFAPKLIYQLSFLLLEYVLLGILKFIHKNAPYMTLSTNM